MSRIRIHYFAILGLLLGQWCAVVHASGHDLLKQPEKTPCAICVVAHASGVTPSAVTLPLLSAPVSVTADAALPVSPAIARVAPPQSRAPPSILA
ncbi:MAG: hypothetical protein ACRETW_05470 [Stenotrophobium sp.]